MSALQGLQPRVTLTKTLTDFNDPTLEVSYQPALPEFSIRTIVATIAAADSRFSVSVSKPPTPEERSSAMQRHEQRVLLRHLLFTIIVAVPTFIIGVVYMSLVSSQDPTREYLMRPIWGGNASSAQWALFFLATPVMFYGAWTFHRRSIKEIISLWHRNSATPLSRRFTRFGSMNLLASSDGLSFIKLFMFLLGLEWCFCGLLLLRSTLSPRSFPTTGCEWHGGHYHIL